jgi:hypothetical protein
MRATNQISQWTNEALPVRENMADCYEQLGAYMLAFTVAEADIAYLSLKAGDTALYSPKLLAAVGAAFVTSSVAGFFFNRSRESRDPRQSQE